MRVPQPGDRWIWVSLPQYTVAVVVAGGRVVDAPPIARWAIGKDERYIADYFRRRGAQITPLES